MKEHVPFFNLFLASLRQELSRVRPVRVGRSRETVTLNYATHDLEYLTQDAGEGVEPMA